jgi:hypothetical protein
MDIDTADETLGHLTTDESIVFALREASPFTRFDNP